jgi:lipopolysaccharide export system protein LptA
MKRALWVSVIALSLASPVLAQQANRPAAPANNAAPSNNNGVLGIGASKAPISIDADKLQVFDKEQRAVYTGNVVVVQGETTMKAAHMTVFYERANQDQQPVEPGTANPGGAALRRVEAKGGVVITSKDQIAKGDNGILDRENDRMILTGNVSLSQGENITKGERLFYNLTTGIATIEGGRVRSLLVPGSEEAAKANAAPAPSARPQNNAPSQQKPKP